MQPRPTDPSRDRRRAWIWIGLGVLAVALCIGWLTLPVGEWVAAFQRRILGLGVWGVAIFAGVFIAATLILAPDWPLAVAAGMVYGLWAVPVVLASVRTRWRTAIFYRCYKVCRDGLDCRAAKFPGSKRRRGVDYCGRNPVRRRMVCA